MRVLTVLGTRPEVIKLAPVLRVLGARPRTFDVRLCITAQHRDLLDPMLALFDLRPDIDLDVMRAAQSPTDVIARVLAGLDPILDAAGGGHPSIGHWRPDWMVVQGDTTTTLAAALGAHHHRVRVAHVEAGLRTGRLDAPFPEEMNRRLLGALADRHFAPTPRARDHLLGEGVPAARVTMTGNTGVDALRWALEQPAPAALAALDLPPDAPVLFVTAHRRESFGAPLERVCRALREIAARFGPALRVVFSVHPNPQVDGPVRRGLGGVPGVTLTPPLDYVTCLHLLRRATIVLTDSGGLQEEAPSVGTPVLVLRDVTERSEGVDLGFAVLVGTDPARIVAETSRLLEDPGEYRRRVPAANPYGDGHAAERIADVLGADL